MGDFPRAIPRFHLECSESPFSTPLIETNNPVVISTYGCIQGAENKRHFKAGLEAMIKTLEPSLVLVHGPMPEKVFSDVINKSEFIQFPDWITRVKGGD